MKRIVVFILSIVPLVSFCQTEQKLWYAQPANEWTDALPVGNGRLGAMIFGGIENELIQLNEGTLWTGGPVRKNVNPEAYENFILARQEALKDNFDKANDLLKKVQGYYSESYLPLGNLMISHEFNDKEPSAYY